MRTHRLLTLLFVCALMTSCVQAIDPARFGQLPPTPTSTPEILAEIPFTTIDVFAQTSMGERALLPAYVGTPEIKRSAGQWQNSHSMIELDAPTVFVVETEDPSDPAVAALPAETQAALLETDFSQALVFILLHGGAGLDDYTFVESILLDKEGVRLHIENWYKPGTGSALPAASNYP